MNDFINNKEIWTQVAKTLEANSGLALVELPATDIPGTAFERARQVLQDDDSSKKPKEIPENADSAHATGYHPANNPWSRRYNRYREGFVFSDGQQLPELQQATLPLEDLLHSIAQAAVGGLERHWELPEGWFEQNMGPCRSSSQWHLKRYVEPPNHQEDDEDETAQENQAKGEEKSSRDEPMHLLPTHTDPSLISVVLHHQNERHGLEYSHKLEDGKREWRSVSSSSTDTITAVILVGSVLAHMTAGHVAACKHRVVSCKEESPLGTRMAATLFVRPAGTAILQVPPAPRFDGKHLKRQVTFDAWSARVARNYQKSKRPPPQEQVNLPQTTSCRVAFNDGVTELSLISCDPPLNGPEKYLGGELAQNGKIYTIPGHAGRVLCIDPNDDTIVPLGPTFSGQYKWLRSVRLPPTGVIVGLPCHADSMLRIDPKTNQVTTLEWKHIPLAPEPGTKWKWHGGQISPVDGCLYCVPQRATRVLKLNPETEEISFLEGEALEGRNKWYGGLLGSDGAIYGIPQCHTSVLRIDPITQRVTLHGNFPDGGYKWHGGIVGPDGAIYGIPAHADTVLKIVPGPEPKITTFGGPLRTGSHRNDGKYKYLGAANGGDGKIYLFPSDTDYVLQIDPERNTCREVGPNLKDIGEKIHHNKWQNGFTTQDKSAMYGIPLKGSSVLRIVTKGKDEEPEIAVVGSFDGLNHWEGGVMSENGDMFCMPLNHPDVLRIRHLKK